jgi:hypothetical protein
MNQRRSADSASAQRGDLLQILFVVLRHLLDAVRYGNIISNQFDPGELFLRNIGQGNHPAEILHEKLPFLGKCVIDEELARVGMGRASRCMFLMTNGSGDT